jgi:cellulose synthase/poly-beta-1,6-N-acetylglucosamine synthase-like glycosyltransferase
MTRILYAAYFFTTAALLCYSLQCLVLLILHARGRRRMMEENARIAAGVGDITDWPMVTTQLPLYNERNVAERVLRAAAQMDYPAGRHEIQVLDDSTDDTCSIVDCVVAELRTKGAIIHVVRRELREGFKAGALREGMRTATGGLHAIFDADFIPPPDFLQRTVPVFLKMPRVGFVQARWAHINDRDSLLTAAQATGIDTHFVVEQSARASAGAFMNFNGTCGVWRREAIETAGGWQADTLTEDLDLSYRAHLAGWTAHYLPDLAVPGEIPASMAAYRRQQFRWAKGSIQTARKLLPRVLAAPVHPLRKIGACLHLTYFSVHLLLLIHCMLSVPILLWCRTRPPEPLFSIFCIVGGMLLLAPAAMYLTGWWTLHRNEPRRLLTIPAIVLLGGGLSLSNGCAVLQALAGRKSPFLRTPKVGDTGGKVRAPRSRMPFFEIVLGLYAAVALFIFLRDGGWFLGPFLLVYVGGLLWLGIQELMERRNVR